MVLSLIVVFLTGLYSII